MNAKSVHLTLPPALDTALDAFILSLPDPRPSRPEAIRRLVEEALAAKRT